ncbi:restriction endonuclease subunit S [Ligilactobacillus acidipiscis]|uniref:Type I restriction-modification system, specificity subunit S n=1 Tax=Ligilactobacillus acidipiscis TaxID=89059 RepID=A0A1K1KQF3_9LACO|nr:restriction endonuclease subunit S [Ligilactobacillus acidipiscis]SFV39638.1 Type I restriction-modification system, specificity subunit S [Ligilactobacillus acidipiscis]
MKVELGNYVDLVNEKLKIREAKLENYVSTENLLPDRKGIVFPAKSLPNSKLVQSFKKGDVLVSNIRPYFKKIWHANIDGCRSGDVLDFRTNNKNLLQDYLYVLLQTDTFFKYVTTTSKGTKMPRGDKSAIKQFKIELPNLDVQKNIAYKIKVIEAKIALNEEINDNLETIRTVIFNRLFANKMLNQKNGKIKQIASLSTGKRPKRKHDYSSPNHNIPIVGASKVMGYTSSVLYDNYIITTGRVGTHGIIQRYKEPIWVSDNSFVFMSDHQDYLYEILKNFVDYSSLNRGSTQPLITQTDLKNVDIYIPSESEFDNFENLTKYITESQFNLRIENVKLDNLKRMLLENYFV